VLFFASRVGLETQINVKKAKQKKKMFACLKNNLYLFLLCRRAFFPFAGFLPFRGILLTP